MLRSWKIVSRRSSPLPGHLSFASWKECRVGVLHFLVTCLCQLKKVSSNLQLSCVSYGKWKLSHLLRNLSCQFVALIFCGFHLGWKNSIALRSSFISFFSKFYYFLLYYFYVFKIIYIFFLPQWDHGGLHSMGPRRRSFFNYGIISLVRNQLVSDSFGRFLKILDVVFLKSTI